MPMEGTPDAPLHELADVGGQHERLPDARVQSGPKPRHASVPRLQRSASGPGDSSARYLAVSFISHIAIPLLQCGATPDIAQIL